jgi:beta-N-acetylglucosaminidase
VVVEDASADSNVETVEEEVTVTGDKLDKKLKGNLKGLGNEFVDAGKEHDIDPVFLVALAAQETGWGKSDISNAPWNNVGGITCAPELYEEIFGESYPDPGCEQLVSGGTNWQKFASVEDSIAFKAAYLKQQYLEDGRETINEIQEKYAPHEADNDQKGLNNYWVDNIVAIMNKINDEIHA